MAERDDGGVARSASEEVLDGVDGADATACANARAVQRSGSASKIELLLQRPALQKCVNEAGVEEVARAGGVDRVDAKRGSVMKLRAIPREHPVDTQRCGRQAAIEEAMHGGQSFLQIVGGGQLAGDVAAGDEVIDILQERFDAGIQFIEVRDHRNACGARPSCGLGRGLGVVAIKMKGAGIDNPLALEFLGAQSEAVVAPPEDGALTGVVDENERLLARAIGGREEMRFHSQAREFPSVECGRGVSTDFANVARVKSPLLARDNSGGSLSAGQNSSGTNCNFGAAPGIVCHGDKRVRGVEAHANEVDFFYLRAGGHLAEVTLAGRGKFSQAKKKNEAEDPPLHAEVEYAG